MIPSRSNPLRGIYAATICPLAPDGRIDETALADHLLDATSTEGIVGVLINGHAGENATLSRAEKKRVVEVAHSVVGQRAILVCGINAESSIEAAEHAHDAEVAGGDVLLVFPPFSWALSQDETMALVHHRHVSAASALPLMLYQAGVGTQELPYSESVLAALIQLPNVVGIKEGSWETSRYEANRRLVHGIAPHVAVMASGDEHLLACMCIGSEGSLVSLAVLVPDLIVALDRAIAASDIATARKINDRIYPLATAIYRTSPAAHANARLKACLKLLGKLDHALMRPPIGPLCADEMENLELALTAAGLLPRAATEARMRRSQTPPHPGALA